MFAPTQALLSGGLPSTLRRLLATSPLFSSSTTSASSVLRSTDQLLEVCPAPCHCFLGRTMMHVPEIRPASDHHVNDCYKAKVTYYARSTFLQVSCGSLPGGHAGQQSAAPDAAHGAGEGFCSCIGCHIRSSSSSGGLCKWQPLCWCVC